MKKIITFSLVLFLMFILAACTTANSTTTASTTASQTTEYHEPVTITYAAWNLGASDLTTNLERLMLDAFEIRYPWITVNIIERPKVPDSTGLNEIDQNWNEFLGARSAQGTLPDVYFTDSTETTIMNNWSMDVTALATADSEFMNISSDLRNAANYGGKIMAIPYAVYYFGYFINKTIFDNGNADFPVFTDTWAQFISKIEDVANHAPTNGSGIAGLFGIDRILEWYPAQINPDLGWFTYDGTLLHIDGSEFETALNLYKTLLADKTLVLESMDGTEQEAAFGAGGTWERSKLAAFWTESYNIGSMLDLEFSIDFIGTPGVTSHKIPVILDLMCISSQTDHPEEAFLLAKWMSFGKEGYLKRIDISTNVEGVTALNMTPLQPDVEMLDAFFGIYQGFTEFRKVVEYSDYIIEPNKYVPGYIPARWTKEYNETYTLGEIFDLVRTGEITFADVKTNWNTLANGELNTSRTAVFDKLGVD